MIRAIAAGLGLAVAALACLFLDSPAHARNARTTAMHPMCNVLWPCTVPSGGKVKSERAGLYPSKQDRARIARAERFRNVDFGSPMVPPETARSWLNGLDRPARYIGGRLKCAVNVNAALAARGIRGTGSALAHSFDRWGVRSPVPVVGAVAVTDRRGGGHVAIVSRVHGGRVFVWNPSSRGRGWREVEYTNRRARYRVAG